MLLLLAVAVCAAPVHGSVIIEYFHQQGCANCERVDPLIGNLEAAYGDRIALRSVEVDDREGVRLLLSYGVTEVPVVVINRNRTLPYPEITREGLDREIRLAEAGAYPIPAKRRTLFDEGPVPALLVSFVLGLMTGFSPCLLGSLVVILAAGRGAGPGTREKYAPLVFGSGILAGYLLLAAAIFLAGIAFRPDPGLRLLLRGAGGLTAIGVGLVQAGLFSLPDRPGAYADGLALKFRSVPGIFLLGLIFAVLFAPCAIAPFFVFAGGLLLNPSFVPALMLPAFSLGVLAPFALLTISRSVLGERLLNDAGIVRRAGGAILILFGVWLIFFA